MTEHPPMMEQVENAPVEVLLKDARASYQALLARFRNLDRGIAAEAPGWAEDERFCPKLVRLCLDIALLMLGADHRYTESELQAFNTLFGLQESLEDVSEVAARMQEPRPGPAEFFSHLDRFLEGLSVAEFQTGQDLVAPAREYFLNLARVIALIDDDYHADELGFHKELTRHLRTPATLPPGTALMLRLDDGSLLSWPIETEDVTLDDTLDDV